MRHIRVKLTDIDGYVSSELFDDSGSASGSSDRVRLVRDTLFENTTPKQRTYLILYYKKRMTMDGIADECGVSKSTVSRTISRGRNRILRGMKREELQRLFESLKSEEGDNDVKTGE